MGLFQSKARQLWYAGKLAFLDATYSRQRVRVLHQDCLFERECQQLAVRLDEPDAVQALDRYIDYQQKDLARRLQHPNKVVKLRHAQRKWDNGFRKIMGTRQIPTPSLPGVTRAQPEVCSTTTVTPAGCL